MNDDSIVINLSNLNTTKAKKGFILELRLSNAVLVGEFSGDENEVRLNMKNEEDANGVKSGNLEKFYENVTFKFNVKAKKVQCYTPEIFNELQNNKNHFTLIKDIRKLR